MKIQIFKINIFEKTDSLTCGNKLEKWDTTSLTTFNLYQY